MKARQLTQKRLKELVTYDPESGLMTWKNPKARIKPGTEITCKDSRGYVVVRLDDVLYRVHRLVWLYVHGRFPTLIDHINRNPSDNRLCNLREASFRENLLNQGLSPHNKTGYRGVSFDKQKQLYRACTSKNRKHLFLGYFATPEEAHQRYLQYYQQEKGESDGSDQNKG